jgi:hypothetical protein
MLATKLDISKGLPPLGISGLSPAPRVTVGRVRSTFNRAINSVAQHLVLLAPRDMSGISPSSKNDKIRIMLGV